MAQLIVKDEEGSISIELEEIGRSILSPFRLPGSFSQRSSSIASVRDSDEYELHWAAIEKLPISQRIRTSLFDNTKNGGGEEVDGKRVVDVTKLSPLERQLFIERLIKHIENDNLRISQYDLHIPEMTVRETLDFSARFQGVGSRAGKNLELLSDSLL